MIDRDPLESRLSAYLTGLAGHADTVPVSRFVPRQSAGRDPWAVSRRSRRGLVSSLTAVCVIALAAVVAARLFGASPATGGGSGAALLTAAPVPVTAVLAEPAGQQGDRQLFVFDSVTRVTRPIGTPAAYTVVRLSPRGDVVAALAGDALHVVTVSTGADRTVALPHGTHGGALVWSPDGADVAVVGQHVVMASAAGALVAEASAPVFAPTTSPGQNTGTGSSTVSSGGYQWSPDGHRFTAVVNGGLIIIGIDVSSTSAPLRSLLPGISDPTFVVLAGWHGSDTIVLGTPDTVTPYASPLTQGGTVGVGERLTAAAGVNLAFVTTIPALAVPQADLDRFAANAQVMYSYRTADGNADFYEVRSGPPSNGGAAPVLVILVRGTTEAIRLPSLTDTHDGDLVDAVLAG